MTKNIKCDKLYICCFCLSPMLYTHPNGKWVRVLFCQKMVTYVIVNIWYNEIDNTTKENNMNNIDIKGTDKKIAVLQLKNNPYYYVNIVRKTKGYHTEGQEITDTYKVNSWDVKDAIRRAVSLVVYREVMARFPHLYITNYDGTIVIEQGYTRDIHIDCGVMDCKPVFNMYTKLHYGVDKVKNAKRRISIESVFKYVADNEN